MTTAYVTVKEAARLTGKSASSIRRVIYPILQVDNHPDRGEIQPSVDEARQLRLKGETFAWRLSEDLLRRSVKVDPAPDAKHGGRGDTRSPEDGYTELLAMLRAELEIKNRQISQQMDLISGLSERLREGNILIGGLQQRLALSDGRDSKPPEPTKAKSVTPAKAEKGTQSSAKSPQRRKGFLARIFR